MKYLLLFSGLYLLGLCCLGQHVPGGIYQGANLDRIAFPIGGMGAGMFCMEGTGAISQMSVRNHPDIFNEPVMFAALYIKGKGSKVLESPVPAWKKFGLPEAAMGAVDADYGLARFDEADFSTKFPFGMVHLRDRLLSIAVQITGWNPFIPTDADNSSLPVAGVEYTITNKNTMPISGVFSYNAKNFIATAGDGTSSIQPMEHGFILSNTGTKNKPEEQGDFAVYTDESKTTVDYCWFQGGWWDALTMAWKKIEKGDSRGVAAVEKDAPGASLYVPFTLGPQESRTIHIYFSLYVPYSNLKYGVQSTKPSDTLSADRSANQPSVYYMPWYASRFSGVRDVVRYWKENYTTLKHNTELFTKAFYRSTLPAAVTEAIGNSFSILKSPTVLRQYDGRFWGWEGCNDKAGSCVGNCTHVYNYAQALCHLFPAMERTIRETELNEGLDSSGHQNYRMAMPIRAEGHQLFLPAADGQLGSIIRAYRDWRISGDNRWMEALYPHIKLCMDYAIRTWDPDHTGTLTEPHHNTYDIEFWGADGMGTGIYLSALEAMIAMEKATNRDGQRGYDADNGKLYEELLEKGKLAMEQQLFNGEYFIQKTRWTGLHSDPMVYRNTAELFVPYSPEEKNIIMQYGPKYQYGNGCLSDGVIGCWLARTAGLKDPISEQEVKQHLASVYRYNFKTDLSNFSNPQRSTFAAGKDGGLLLCSWPKGGEPYLPFVYSNEVWTGVEYEVASHLIMEGAIKKGLAIVRTVSRRYDGTVRNPFDQYECGHYYMRSMSCYALLQALTGVRYDAVDKILYVDSRVGDFVSFLSTGTGFGNVTYKRGKVGLKVVYGSIEVKEIKIIKKGAQRKTKSLQEEASRKFIHKYPEMSNQ
jgi:uncharacterized protein (DUF608 family)